MELFAHRIPRALLVALLVGGLLGGAVGFATADSDPVPEAFSVAEPMVDDRWQYELTVVIDEPDGSSEEHAVATYAYDEPFDWYDGDGRAFHVMPLKETIVWSDEDEEQAWEDVYYIDAATGDVVGTRSHYPAMQLTWSGGLSVGSFPPSSGGETRVDVEIERFGGDQPFCGYRSPLQSTIDIPVDSVRFDGMCVPDGDEFGLADHVNMSAIEVGSVHGLESVRFRAAHDGGTTDLWMARPVPYPVLMEVQTSLDLAIVMGDIVGSETYLIDIHATWELIGYEPGTLPWGTDVAPSDMAVPPVVPAPREVWGPNDDGIDHPFSLREAFEGARDSATYTDLRDYLAAHPDAVMVDGDHYINRDEDGTKAWVWDFTMSDGEELHQTIASRPLPESGTPQGMIADLAGPQDSYESPERIQFQMLVDWYASPDEMPDTMPTVASMFARFEALYANPGNAWGFTVLCFATCQVDVVAGHSQRTYEDAGTLQPAGYTGSFELLAFDHEGRATAHEVWTEESRPQQTLGPSGGIQASTQAHVDKPITLSSVVWEAPPAPVATSLGILGVLAGIVYWLWPALKALPFFGLFSRVHGEQLLEHPVRAQIMDTIRTRPGTHYQALVNSLGKGRGTVEHHLRKLEASQLIVSRKTAGYTCYYVKGAVDRRVMEGLHTIKSGTAAKLLEAIVARPGVTAKQLTGQLGISPSTVSHHLARMREAGLIDAEGARNAALHPTALSKDALSARLT